MLTKPKIGQKIHLRIERLGINAEGVGHYQGFTIFVDHALPEEEVIAELYECRKSFGRAKVLQYLKSSSHRVVPACPLFTKCGGCQSMHLDYPQQLVMKRQTVKDALERIGKFSGLEILPCIPSPSPLGYRNKIQLPVTATGGVGLYAWNTHDVVEIDRCYIHSPLGEKVLQNIRTLLKAFSHVSSEIKHVLIKTGVFTSQVLVVLVTAKEKIPHLQEIGQNILLSIPEIKGVVQNVNPTEGNFVLGKKFHLLAGNDFIEEELCGLSFKVSPASFFQVNPFQAQNIYLQVLKLCELSGKETLLDAYCGVGTLALILAKHAHQVIGVECIAEAIEDAKENAERNQIKNAEFVCAQAENYIQELQSLDVAILNPPRKGCDPSLLEKLILLKPRRIIYVSCNPATLARDLAILSHGGYTIDIIQPYDMFPQTSHVETVVRLSNNQ